MITRSEQVWKVGETVRVGFLRLRVLGVVATPGNYMPDQYALADDAGTRFYRFIPYNGLTRCASLAEALIPA